MFLHYSFRVPNLPIIKDNQDYWDATYSQAMYDLKDFTTAQY